MAPKGVCVLKSEKVNGVVKFEQEVRIHDLVFGKCSKHLSNYQKVHGRIT